jgi:hypothetical protein
MSDDLSGEPIDVSQRQRYTPDTQRHTRGARSPVRPAHQTRLATSHRSRIRVPTGPARPYVCQPAGSPHFRRRARSPGTTRSPRLCPRGKHCGLRTCTAAGQTPACEPREVQ